jgi:PA14 domain
LQIEILGPTTGTTRSFIDGQDARWRIRRSDQPAAVEVRISTSGKDPEPKSKPVSKPPELKEGKLIVTATEPATGRGTRIEVVYVKEKLIAAKNGKFPLGLRYRFYSGGAPTKVATIPDMALVHTGVMRSPSYQFIFEDPANPDRTPWDKAWGFEASGFIDAPIDGVYQFVGGSDDGLTISIAGQLVVDNDGNHGYLRKSGTIALAAGLHPVRIGYYNAGGGGAIDVQWRAPGGELVERVPDAVWRHDPNEKPEKRKDDKKAEDKKPDDKKADEKK